MQIEEQRRRETSRDELERADGHARREMSRKVPTATRA